MALTNSNNEKLLIHTFPRKCVSPKVAVNLFDMQSVVSVNSRRTHGNRPVKCVMKRDWSNETGMYRARAINFRHLLPPLWHRCCCRCVVKKGGTKGEGYTGGVGWKKKRRNIQRGTMVVKGGSRIGRGCCCRLICVQGGAWRHWWLMAVINQPIEFHSVDISLPPCPPPPTLDSLCRSPLGSKLDEAWWNKKIDSIHGETPLQPVSCSRSRSRPTDWTRI